MKIEQVYLELLEVLNRNFTNDNVALDKSRFVLLFNRAQDIFEDLVFERKHNDDIREIQNLLIDKPLEVTKKEDNYYLFSIPKDFYSFSNVVFYGSKDHCENKRLYSFEIKNFNSEEILQDEFQKPSFFAREVPYYLSNNKIKVFKEDFSIDKCVLEYYRQPKRVDIAGYNHFDGTPSTNIDPEFSDKITRKIINIAAEEFQLNQNSSPQAEQYRTQKNLN